MGTVMNNTKEKFLVVTQKLNEGVIAFKLQDGQTITFDSKKVNNAIREQAMYHGFNQKIRDAAAGFGKAKDYDGAFEEMMKVVEGLYNGDWNRKGGSGTSTAAEDIAAALMKLKNITIDQARTAISKADEDRVKSWMKVPAFAAAVAEAKARRLAAKVAEGEGEGEIDIDFGGEGEEKA